MKHAEQVTFGGSGLDRAAHLRGDPAALKAAAARSDAVTLLLWRGKLLFEGGIGLACVSTGHPILTHGYDDVAGGAIFLGVEGPGQVPVFARDISGWQAEGQDLSLLGQFFDPSEQTHPDLPPGYSFAELRKVMARLSPRDAELAATARALVAWHSTHGFCSRCGDRSQPAQGGWQRDCPSCSAHHFPRTDPVVIMLILHGNSVLMGRSPGWPEGMYSLLAGFVEPGETLEAAVRREVAEEAGVKVGDVSYLASQPWPFPASLMIGCRGEALSRDITIDPAEIEDAIWVEREEMMQVFAGEHPKIKPARVGAIAHFILLNWLSDRLD